MTHMRISTRRDRVAALVAAVGLMLVSFTNTGRADSDEYQLMFELRLTPGESQAVAAIRLRQSAALLREARFRAPADQFTAFTGDGQIKRDGKYLTWTPPADGGQLEYRVDIDHIRSSGSYDAIVRSDWALFRADDIFPAARTKQRKGAYSQSTLHLELPTGWSVSTPFANGSKGDFVIDNPDRLFDRPTGWIIAGKFGRRRDQIAGIDVTVSAPIGIRAQRIAKLALLRWTLPWLTKEIDSVPPRLSIVSAGDPMWRGGLSAPNSLFVHNDRPLLSANGTSTLVHEAVHVLVPLTTTRNHDLIDEGIAEYVTLRLLRDSGTISQKRFVAAIDGFDDRGVSPGKLRSRSANGNVRARAVVIFYALDAELIRRSDGEADIFELLRRLSRSPEPIDAQRMQSIAHEIVGGEKLTALDFDM